MSEDDSQDWESIQNGYLSANTEEAVILYAHVMKRYGLKDGRYIKRQSHLCLYCDLFFQHSSQVLDYNLDGYNIKEDVDNESDLWSSISQTYAYPHWPRFYLLIRSAQHGCHICQLALSQLTDDEQQKLVNFEKTHIQYGRIGMVHFGTNVKYLQLRFESPPEMAGLEGFILRLAMNQIESEICTFSEPALTNSDRPFATWEVAFAWITNCLVNHSDCRHYSLQSPRRPRRLIDVGCVDGIARLCKVNELDPNASYVTLSHCWGPEGIPFKLCRSNESSMFEGIPESSISQTFKDAFDFTRKLRVLGVKYIWIDALCILQDCQEDWDDQALIMGEIYGGAFCNLAASTGRDGTSGLYPKLDGISRRTCTIKEILSRPLKGPLALQNRDIMGNGVRDSTILSRGWCVQELVLAPRVLYFGRDYAAWDCSTLTAEDSAPTQKIASELGYLFHGRKFQFWGRVDQPDGNTPIDEDTDTHRLKFYHLWLSVLRVYTYGNLTRHTDRLIAIGGIARWIHTGLGDGEEYIAGLWKSYLHVHLCWQVQTGHQGYRLYPYRAPSWSWGSVEGSVYNHLIRGPEIRDCVSLILASAKVDLKTTNVYGAVTGGVLHIEGPIFKAVLGPRGNNVAAHLGKLLFPHDGDGEEIIAPHLINIDVMFPGPEHLTIYCLLLLERDDYLGGMILVPQDADLNPGRYIRIGASSNLPKELLGLARNSWRLTQGEYEGVGEAGDYRISIV